MTAINQPIGQRGGIRLRQGGVTGERDALGRCGRTAAWGHACAAPAHTPTNRKAR